MGTLPPAALKAEVITAVHVLAHEGLIDAFGHVSALVPGEDLIYILGHTHLTDRTPTDVTVEDIVTIDLNGEVVEGAGEPPGERFIHTAVYRARRDVGAVVHVHPPLTIGLSAAGVAILPVWTQGSVFAPAVPIHDYPAQIDAPALGAEVASTLGAGAAVVLRSHGAVTVGATVPEACVIAVNMERTAWIQWWGTAVGRPRPIEPEYLEGGMMRGVSREEYVNAYWVYYVNRSRRK